MHGGDGLKERVKLLVEAEVRNALNVTYEGVFDPIEFKIVNVFVV